MSERGRILLLDQDTRSLAAATGLLEGAGFEVVISGRQHHRLEFIGLIRPDLVVLGVGLPYMAGDEVLRGCAAGALSVPVLILSPSDPVFLEDLVHESGAAGYLH